jgi:hypothetical protein
LTYPATWSPRAGSRSDDECNGDITPTDKLLLARHSKGYNYYVMLDFNSAPFRRSLREAVAWCPALSLRHLRSASLKPSFTLDAFGMDTLWAEAVTEVVAKRSQLMGQISAKEGSEDETSGRLLLFVPSETLFDGAAQLSSNGFLDVGNVTPWDIWVHFSERTLVSWVPPVLVNAAQMGIDANPEGCIRWAS